jgi:hypothetical protein
MTLDRELLELMPQTVSIEVAAGQNEYGERTYGAPVEVRARVEGRTRVVTTMTGEERVSTSTVYLGEVVCVGPNDRITLPAGYTPQQPEILAIERMPDEKGDFYEAVLT